MGPIEAIAELTDFVEYLVTVVVGVTVIVGISIKIPVDPVVEVVVRLGKFVSQRAKSLKLLWFVDTFDGVDLGDHWELLNPDPNSYIVENGSLSILAAATSGLTRDDLQNIFRLTKGLPPGGLPVPL